MLKTLAISVLLFALLLVVGFFVGVWTIDWRLGAGITAILGFSAAVHWATEYLEDHF